MRKVELNMKEKQKYEKIKEYVDHGGNKNRIALQLNISRRQVPEFISKLVFK